MKRVLLLLILLVVSSVACQKDDANIGLPESDVLYRTWRLTGTLYEGQDIDHEQYITVVTFTRDGNFRGTQSKDDRWCCMPVAFEGTDNAIRFIWDTSNPSCALLNCRVSPLWAGVDWRITTLTNKRLVLTGDKMTLTYEPIP